MENPCFGPCDFLALLGMIGNIRKQLEITPFIPIPIQMEDRKDYSMPAIDPIYLPPPGKRVVDSDDESIVDVLPGLMINRLVCADDPL